MSVEIDEIRDSHIALHSTGVGGAFYVVTFSWHDPDESRDRSMVAIVFGQPYMTSVLDLNETLRGNIDRGDGNEWRGEAFEPALRKLIARWNDDRAHACTKHEECRRFPALGRKCRESIAYVITITDPAMGKVFALKLTNGGETFGADDLQAFIAKEKVSPGGREALASPARRDANVEGHAGHQRRELRGQADGMTHDHPLPSPLLARGKRHLDARGSRRPV
jgi:hypothetical protein